MDNVEAAVQSGFIATVVGNGLDSFESLCLMSGALICIASCSK